MKSNNGWLQRWLARGTAGKPDESAVDYPSPEMLARFKELRDTGAIHPLKTGACATCDQEIPTGFAFCSKACQTKSEVEGDS